jgi:hypothetical protein
MLTCRRLFNFAFGFGNWDTPVVAEIEGQVVRPALDVGLLLVYLDHRLDYGLRPDDPVSLALHDHDHILIADVHVTDCRLDDQGLVLVCVWGSGRRPRQPPDWWRRGF